MVKIKGSKDGNILTARFNGHSKSRFASLKQTKALVLISIRGNQYCTGQYLKSIIDTASKEHGFTTFLIADEVSWHNLCTDFSDKNATPLRRQAIAMGQAFFEDHLEYFVSALNMTMSEFDSAQIAQLPLDKQATLNKLAREKSNFEVVFWQDWLEKSMDFELKKDRIMALYETDPELQQSVVDVASDFARRHQSESIPFELVMEQSTRYLIEESPAVMWVAAALDYNFVVYPGDIIQSFESTKKHFVKSQSGDAINDLLVGGDNTERLVNWLEVSFQRSRGNDFIDSKPALKKSSTNNNDVSSQAADMTAMMKGVTEGVFALDVNDEKKVQLLADILLSYQKKCMVGSEQ